MVLLIEIIAPHPLEARIKIPRYLSLLIRTFSLSFSKQGKTRAVLL
jgi:hypothetical protein